MFGALLVKMQLLSRNSGLSYAHGLLTECAFDGKRHLAINQSEQGVIFTNTDVYTWVKTCAALANNDAAGIDDFTTEFLHTQHFWL